jgi:serine/threonine-protein kinase HipA
VNEDLAVWLGDEPVGALARTGRRFQFQFTRSAEAVGLLTVASEGTDLVWTKGFTRAWFDNLLPEETRRTAAEAQHGVDGGDSFGLLGAIGWECAGAVSVLPNGRRPASGSYQPLDEEEIWERLDALPRTVAGLDREVRLSLGGAQEKLLLARVDGRWHLPLAGAVSTHILKPEPDRYPGLAVGEAWALAVASAATLTAKADFVAPDGHRPVIIVERYDRVARETRVDRIHQEDGCQVLGLAPEQKYPNGTGKRVASLARIAAKLVARAENPIAELRRLLEQTTVNVALLNTDAHARNVSVLHSGPRTITLSPLYDVAPTVWFFPVQNQAALPVGGKWKISEITRAHLFAEAEGWGMPAAVARSIIDGALAAVTTGIAEADDRFPAVPPAMREAVKAQLRRLASSDWE